MILIGYMLLSVSWSDIPFISFKRWIRELLAVVMAFLVLTEQDPRLAVQSVLKRISYILIPFSFLLIHYFSYFGREYSRWSGELMWIGVTLQKNSLGRLCITAAFFLIWTLIRRWQKRETTVSMFQNYADVLVLVIALYLLKGPEGAYSAGAIAAFIGCLAMFFSYIWMGKRKIYLGANALTAVMVFVIGIGVYLPIAGGNFAEGIATVLGRDETLTGRTEIWASILPEIERQPFFGHGFSSFWTEVVRYEHNIGEAHNGYLEVLLELGSVGLFFFVMYLISFCRMAQKEIAYDFDWNNFCVCYLLMSLVANISDSAINSFCNHQTAVILFLSICFTTNNVRRSADSQN
jgi:O-antigen ligase